MTRRAAKGSPPRRHRRPRYGFPCRRRQRRSPSAARPCRPGRHHLLDAGQPAPDDRRRSSAALAISSSFSARPASQRASPAMTSVATTTSPDFSDGSSPPATPKVMTPRMVDGSNVASSARNCCGSLLTADDGHAGPGRDAGLLHQTCHDQYRPRINRIAPRTVRSSPRPQIHIPTPTTLLLVLLKFRYRASAQSGKNFE